LKKTLELPLRQQQRILSLLAEFLSRKRCTLLSWQKLLGELRFVSPGVAGSRGLFGILQVPLVRKTKGRIRITRHIRLLLTTFRQPVEDLLSRPTHLSEIIAELPKVVGAMDACSYGLGGVYFATGHSPKVWRHPLPQHIVRRLVSSDNPSGDITNSDLEQAAMVVQLDNIADSYDVRGATISNLTDNTPTLTRHFKGSTATSRPAAYLCQISSLHQRYHRYCSEVSFINGVENVMADDASCLQHLTNSEFLHHFNSRVPPGNSLDALPESIRYDYLSDLHIAKTWELQANLASTQQHASSAWHSWQHFCTEIQVRTDLAGHPDPIQVIQVYIVQLRQRRCDKGGKTPIRADTISKHLSAIIQESATMVDMIQANMGLWHPGQERHISISHLLRAFSRTDPAPNRVWPINTTILLELLAMPQPKKFSEEHWLAVCQPAAMGFYYPLRPGEYAKSRSNAKDHDILGKPFRLHHASFLLIIGKYHVAHLLTPRCKRRCNDFELSTMYMAMLSFDDQKSTAKGDRVCQQYIGGTLCPSKAVCDRVYLLIDHVGKKTLHPEGINAPLYSYFVPATAKKKHSWSNVITSQLTAALRLAADGCKDRTGIPPKLINARSLHAGGATALLCASVGKDVTKILGRWCSDAMDVYLCTSTHTATAGFSNKMFDAGGYKFAKEQEASTLPHLIPEEATSDAQDEYISQLMVCNDDCDTFDDPELGRIAPEGRPTKLTARK